MLTYRLATIFALSIATSVGAHAEVLYGKWSEDGCQSENSELYEFTRQQDGQLNVSGLEWGCNMVYAGYQGTTLVYNSACAGEGDEWRGQTTITMTGADKLEAQFPGGNGKGWTASLRRCR